MPITEVAKHVYASSKYIGLARRRKENKPKRKENTNGKGHDDGNERTIAAPEAYRGILSLVIAKVAKWVYTKS